MEKPHGEPKPITTAAATRSNDRKMKQDFPGYPHHPAGEDTLGEKGAERAAAAHEGETTATGSESQRGERPQESDNEVK